MPTALAQRIAPDVHLIRGADPDIAGVPRNALVLGGPDPTLVGTGAARDRDRFWSQVEQVVGPATIRWIFVGTDHPDHVGNLAEALERCAGAQVVVGDGLVGRLEVDPSRLRWVGDGHERLGSRVVEVVRPPVFDAPTTRGLYDATSGVYWAVDAFGLSLPHRCDDVGQLDRDVWDREASRYHRSLAPWITSVDPARLRQLVARVAALDLRAIVSAHGPTIGRHDLAHAFDQLADLPGAPTLGDLGAAPV